MRRMMRLPYSSEQRALNSKLRRGQAPALIGYLSCQSSEGCLLAGHCGSISCHGLTATRSGIEDVCTRLVSWAPWRPGVREESNLRLASAMFLIVGFAATLFTYFCNLFFGGLHSYA